MVLNNIFTENRKIKKKKGFGILKRLNENVINFLYEGQTVLLSSYLLPGAEYFIDSIALKYPDHYLLCVGYPNKKDNLDDGDFQLGLTGTRKEWETLTCKNNGIMIPNAYKRELLEETGLTPQKMLWIDNITTPRSPFCKFSAPCCVVSAEALKCAEYPWEEKGREGDIKITSVHNDKMSIMVHGTRDRMHELLLSTKLSQENKDKITFLTAIPIQEAVKMCKIIRWFRTTYGIKIFKYGKWTFGKSEMIPDILHQKKSSFKCKSYSIEMGGYMAYIPPYRRKALIIE